MLHDPVEMSLRDLAAMALSVSDNAAADTLFALVGPERITALLHRFGIRSFDVVAPMSPAARSRRPTGSSWWTSPKG